MSVNWYLMCVPCRQRLCVGQGGWLYTGYYDKEGRRHIDRFLNEHCGRNHLLHYLSDQDEGMWDESEDVEYLDVPKPAQA